MRIIAWQEKIYKQHLRWMIVLADDDWLREVFGEAIHATFVSPSLLRPKLAARPPVHYRSEKISSPLLLSLNCCCVPPQLEQEKSVPPLS